MTTNLTPPDEKPVEPVLYPPDSRQPVSGKPSNLRFILFLAFIVFVLLDLAILAYFFLAGQTEPVQEVQPRQEKVVKTNGSTPEGPLEIVQPIGIDKAKNKAETLRSNWLLAQAEADNIRDWGGQLYIALSKKAEKGEQFFYKEDFLRAQESFQAAVDDLAALQAARPEILADALTGGRKALQEENSARAVEAYSLALALAPGNPQAVLGLNRAQTLDQVLALYRTALQAETNGTPEEARVLLLRVQDLDPEFIPAAQALVRVQTIINNAEFQQAMDAFLQAVTAGNASMAQQAMKKAKKLQPQSSSVLEGQKQLQQLLLHQEISRLQEEYNHFVLSEDWGKARESCQQIVQIVPQSVFALKGLQVASQRLELDQALQRFLDHPQRLQDEQVLREARQLLAASATVDDPGPRLDSQRAALQQQIEAAVREIPVVLQSDEATDVIVYRVGRLGRFQQRELRLRPGQYTVVGSRPGYHDVRKTFEIKTDTGQVTLRIRCEESI